MPSNRTLYLDALMRAADDISNARAALEAAGHHGTALASLILLPMIRQAADIKNALEALRAAEEEAR